MWRLDQRTSVGWGDAEEPAVLRPAVSGGNGVSPPLQGPPKRAVLGSGDARLRMAPEQRRPARTSTARRAWFRSASAGSSRRRGIRSEVTSPSLLASGSWIA
jgi:hypothetical protein